ncbi:MAG TPA: glucuronate isomerase [Trueperaceae bacterium]
MAERISWDLDPDRCFSPVPAQRDRGRDLYERVAGLPLVCPHGHVSPALLVDPEARLGSPADLFVIPDHYVFRMLYSQGVGLEELGLAGKRGAGERDHRRVWQLFAENFYLFRGTPTGLWLKDELITLFGIQEPLTGESAQRIYDQLEEKLASEEFRARALFERFGIEVLCTTDAATDDLEQHRLLQEDGLNVRPTFRPDALMNVAARDWMENLSRLSDLTGVEVRDYRSFIAALEERRRAFCRAGATASDHGVPSPHTERLSAREASELFERALEGEASDSDAARFSAHMLMEFARMSTEDHLVMQIHAGSLRNHNRALFDRFGPDMGADIPVRTEWTRSLRALLNDYGVEPGFRLIVYTLDESAYGRELAPLAGHYPCLRLGAPWWFFDSVKGMERYLDAVIETAGIYNLAGFNDDTRAFASIPARHDVWRRVTCNWLAGEVTRGLMDEADAAEAAVDLAYGQARRTYRLAEEGEGE